MQRPFCHTKLVKLSVSLPERTTAIQDILKKPQTPLHRGLHTQRQASEKVCWWLQASCHGWMNLNWCGMGGSSRASLSGQIWLSSPCCCNLRGPVKHLLVTSMTTEGRAFGQFQIQGNVLYISLWRSKPPYRDGSARLCSCWSFAIISPRQR